MAFDQKDLQLIHFVQSLVVFTTSEKAQELSLGDRQNLLKNIRDNYAPIVKNGTWAELAKIIDDFKFVITDSVKNNEVTILDEHLPKEDEPNNPPEPEPEPVEEITSPSEPSEEIDDDEDYDDNDEELDSDELDDTSDSLEESEPEPEEKSTKSKVFGKPPKPKRLNIDTSKLKGLMKPKG